MREYDLIAEWYAVERVDQMGVPEVTALAQSIPGSGLVLDVGCGNGIPLTRALLAAGHSVVGLDSSSQMLARFGRNCPDTLAVHAVVQSCPFADAVFDAAVAWGVMFHMNQSYLIKVIASVYYALKSSTCSASACLSTFCTCLKVPNCGGILTSAPCNSSSMFKSRYSSPK